MSTGIIDQAMNYLANVDSLFKIKSYSARITAAAYSYGYASANDLGLSTPAGYTLAGIVNLVIGSTDCPVTNIRLYQTGEGGVLWVRNLLGGAQTIDVTIDVLYLKSEFMAS